MLLYISKNMINLQSSFIIIDKYVQSVQNIQKYQKVNSILFQIIQMQSQYKVQMKVDIDQQRFPYSIVWTALPCITCCMPCIGHTGICRSDGTIYDFVGRGAMHKGELAFGSPLKYLVLDHQDYSAQQWDDAIVRANQKFQRTDHNICINNCHHHVAEVLNELNYKGRSDWGQVDIAFLVLKAKHTSWVSFYVYLIFLMIVVYVLL